MMNATNDFTTIELANLGSVTGGTRAADLGATIKSATSTAMSSIMGSVNSYVSQLGGQTSAQLGQIGGQAAGKLSGLGSQISEKVNAKLAKLPGRS